MTADEQTNPPEATRGAPQITLKAIGSGRKIDLRQTGILTLLVCHGQESVDEATEVHSLVREKYPLFTTLQTASLVNLRIVPRLLRGVVEATIRRGYQEASSRLKEGQRPEDYIVILPDWDGSATRSLGLRNTSSTAGIAILDGEGRILDTFQGDDLAATTVSLLEKYLA